MLAVDCVAPELGLDVIDARLDAHLRRRSRIVAFVDSAWEVADRDALRAHLRGLGAELVAFAAGAIWWCRPDDRDERFVEPAEVVAAATARARERYGCAAATAVIVIDAADRVRTIIENVDVDGASIEAAIGRAASAVTVCRASALVLDRREFAISTIAATFAMLAFGCKRTRDEEPPPPVAPPDVDHTGEIAIALTINGEVKKLWIDPRTSILDLVRERLGMTGTKKGCDAGQCGACTVHLNGQRVNSCLVLAASADGGDITTIEGLRGAAGALHPMQAAFVAHDALQCGYCTPGQIMSAVALVKEGHAKTEAEIREHMSGNICRCGAYANIVAAVKENLA